MILAGLLVAFAVSVLVCAGIVYCRPVISLDQPVARSMHTSPVPRLGGVGLFLGMAAGLLFVGDVEDPLVSVLPMLALLALWLLALLDDFISLPVSLRLLVQCGVVAVVAQVFGMCWASSGPVALWYVIAVFLLVWGINLYNFMDGIDGIAAGQAIVGFGVMACLAWLQGYLEFAFLCALPAVASAAFLFFNFPPARMFMGDSGSTVLGLLMGVLSLAGVCRSVFTVWVPLLLFAPFWVDATATLLGRLWRGERWWEPHRQHHYQRWVMAGYSHQQVATAYAVLSLAGGIAAWQGRGLAAMLPISVICLLVLLVYGALVTVSEYALQTRERQ